MNIRHSVLSTALALALVAPSAHALGLGQLQVKSGLNQPLVAEIPIISATPSELDQLDVRLASPEAFASVGLDRPLELTANLQFSVGKNSRGQPVVRVTTSDKFTEPFLSFLLEAEWGKGTVTREYTALIDPPYIAPAIVRPMATPSVAAAPAPVAPSPAPMPVQEAQTQPAAEPEPVTVAPTAEPEPAPPPPIAAAAPPAPAPAPARAAPSAPEPAARPRPAPSAPAPATPGQYGPVAAGQTLWSIANSVRPDASVSVNQMMLALLHANPEAFEGDNINRLKRGSVLRIPGQDVVGALTAAQAAALVHEQAGAWRGERKPVPQPAESVADTAETPAPHREPKPAPTKPANPRPIAGQPGSTQDRARLQIVPPSGKSGGQAVQSGAASGAGGTELRAELTQAREDLAARTAEVTELKSRVADLEQINDKQQKMIQVQDSEMKALQDRLKQLETQAAQAPVAAPAATPAATPAPAKDTKPAVAKPTKNALPAAAAPEPSPWYLNPLVMGGGVIILLGGLVFALRRGRRKPAQEDAPPVAGRRISEDDALHATLAKNQARQTKPVEDAAPAPAPPAKPEPTQAVPATAAPVVAAADGELQSLNAAIRAKPQDLEAHLNLLRYHHKRSDAAAYEAAAQLMRMHVPSVMDPRWREAVILGAALLPGHPLFSQAGWNAPRFNEPAETAPAAAPPVASPPASPPAAAPEAMAAVAAPVASAVEAFEEVPSLEPVADLDFEPVVEHEEVDAMDFGDGAPSDIHRNEAELMAQDEASATRIELAKAYLDIGDLDGARSMLEEVLTDGSPLAKSEAERILREIG